MRWGVVDNGELRMKVKVCKQDLKGGQGNNKREGLRVPWPRVCMKNAWEACVGRGVPNNKSTVSGRSTEPVSVLTLLPFVSFGLCKRTQSETLTSQFWVGPVSGCEAGHAAG